MTLLRMYWGRQNVSVTRRFCYYEVDAIERDAIERRSPVESAKVREQLDHPVVDADGHWLEPVPVFLEFLRDEAGPALTDQYRETVSRRGEEWYEESASEHMAARRIRRGWWGESAD